MLLALQMTFCLVLILAGAVFAAVGWLGWRGRLRPNRYAGVRTEATLRSPEAFRLGNRAAAPALLAGGAVGLFCGVSLPFLPSLSSVVLVTVIGLIGGFLLVVAGGVAGHRAAEAMQPAGCAGCGGGCCGNPVGCG